MTARDRRSQVAGGIVNTVPVMMQSVWFELRRSRHTMPLPHFRALSVIAHGSRTLCEMAELVHVSPPTMSNTVSLLVARGWVERVADEDDRRRVEVRLTDAGAAAHGEMRAQAEKLVGVRLAKLSDEEIDGLLAGLASIRKAFMGEDGGES